MNWLIFLRREREGGFGWLEVKIFTVPTPPFIKTPPWHDGKLHTGEFKMLRTEGKVPWYSAQLWTVCQAKNPSYRKSSSNFWKVKKKNHTQFLQSPVQFPQPSQAVLTPRRSVSPCEAEMRACLLLVDACRLRGPTAPINRSLTASLCSWGPSH